MIEAIELSAFGQLARGSLWLYPLANIAHVVGAALLLGAIFVFDIHLLRGHYATAAAVAPVALGIAASGVALQVASGAVLFSAEATALVRNPVFLVKMVLVAAALINLAVYHARNRAWTTDRPKGAAAHAALSAGLWLAVVVAGRSIAYV